MPKPNKKNGKITVSVMLPKSIKKQLDQAALATKRTRGGYMELALEAQFKRDGVK